MVELLQLMCRVSGWNSGSAGADPEGLIGVRGEVWVGGIPLEPGDGSGEEARPLPRKKRLFFSLETGCFSVKSERNASKVRCLKF